MDGIRRSGRRLAQGSVVVGAFWLIGACASAEEDLGAAPQAGPHIGLCPTGGEGFTCNGDVAVSCADPKKTIDCADSGRTCHQGVGCVSCVPGTGTCENGQATVCRPDGGGYEQYTCDATQGMTCTPGGCQGACSWGALGESYVGCDYYPTVTLNNGIWKGFEYGIALSNLGETNAEVIVTRGDKELAKLDVAPGKLEVLKLPWVPELKGPDPNAMGQPQPPGDTKLVKQGAYRVRSNRPIAVYQFNPLDYKLTPPPAECPDPTNTGCFSYSNDASLLLPAHTLRRKYRPITWPSLGCKPAFFTITAIADDTEVKLAPQGTILPGGGFDSTGQGWANLNRGDVVQVIATMQGGPFCFQSPGSDISGTLIEATKPVQVIAGNGCANVPAPETQACDHLEEVVLPIETLGREYLVAVPAPPGGPNKNAQHTLRIAAVEDDTTIVFDPPIHEPVTLSANSAPLEIRYIRDAVHVMGTKPLLVAQFMHGTDANADDGVRGDPAQSMAIPSGQYRNEYTFLAPDNYDVSWVDVIARVGESVSIDGEPVLGFVPIGQSGYAAAHHKLGPNSVHRATATKPFGITVYGYGDWTSYMYPGGLNLGTINPTVY